MEKHIDLKTLSDEELRILMQCCNEKDDSVLIEEIWVEIRFRGMYWIDGGRHV